MTDITDLLTEALEMQIEIGSRLGGNSQWFPLRDVKKAMVRGLRGAPGQIRFAHMTDEQWETILMGALLVALAELRLRADGHAR